MNFYRLVVPVVAASLVMFAGVAQAELQKKVFTIKYGSHAPKRFWRVLDVPGRVSHFDVKVYHQSGLSVAYYQKSNRSVTVTGRTGGKKTKGLFGEGGRERGQYFAWVTVYYHVNGPPIDFNPKNVRPKPRPEKKYVMVRFRNDTHRTIRFYAEFYPGRRSDLIRADPGDSKFWWIPSNSRVWDAMKQGGYPRVQTTDGKSYSAAGGVDIITTNGRKPRFHDRQGSYEKIMVFKLTGNRIRLVRQNF